MLRFFIRPARVWVIRYCVTAVLRIYAKRRPFYVIIVLFILFYFIFIIIIIIIIIFFFIFGLSIYLCTFCLLNVENIGKTSKRADFTFLKLHTFIAEKLLYNSISYRQLQAVAP